MPPEAFALVYLAAEQQDNVLPQYSRQSVHLKDCLLHAASLERAGLHPSRVQEVIMGNVISAGLGQVRASIVITASPISQCHPESYHCYAR